MKISFAEPVLPAKGAVVVLVEEGKKLSSAAKELDKQTKGAVTRAIGASKFEGKKGQTLEILAPAGSDLDRILLAGTGKEFDELEQQALGGNLVGKLLSSGSTEVTAIVDAGTKDLATAAANVALGARLASYRFDKYQTKQKDNDNGKPTLKSVTVGVADSAAARKTYGPMDKIADGVFFTRDLVSEPGNVIYPETLAAQCKELTKLGVKVEILDEKAMAKLGMHALLGVGQGSERESRTVVMSWDGGAKSDQPVAFVGKGVTFDSGGISLKPGPGMEEMKWDMGGSGTVIGLMKALAGRKAKVNVVGLVGLVENMPDGKAQRPGDIVTSMSGQTIEIHNTDAEGRLVLADVLWYCQDRFKPQFMVDLATLTGAIIIGLGHEYAGMFANDDKLSDQLFAAGTATGEKVWRMPLHDNYDKKIKSDAADMKNIGGRDAGSITAAQFLQRFVNKTPWVHLDIAGMAWSKEAKPTVPKGATGFGVRLLDRFVADNYEK
ncbi:MAG: leucyl aminopeptidase [Alphaproteobacteria bacterium]|nr:leucyl aminopeptidase [Alphaproteobacteria bacterium]